MNLIINYILKYFNYLEYLDLVKICPYLLNFYDLKIESNYYNKNNLYKINDRLPINLIYKENLYYFLKLLKPIYFFFENFEITKYINNYLILKSKNKDYINFFINLQNITIQSFKKRYYVFDTCIIINQDEILIYVLCNDIQYQNLNFNFYNNNFLIKFTGVKLNSYTKMINNFEIIKSF